MARAGKAFKVDTHPTKDIVVNGLTKDATVQACIFDLIDNSIDSARNTLFQRLAPDARDELPDSYNKYEIKLTLSGADFRIEDNCGGIPVEKLKKLVLRFGERSSHPLGIGAFGVGLNRALFKLGKVSHLKTDTGKQRAELVLNVDDYLRRPNEWELPAEEFNSSGKIGTDIEIRQLPEDIARDFADSDWIKKLRYDIGRRYGHFIAKKLLIILNGTPVKNEEVKIRENPPIEYEGDYKFYKTRDGVSIHVQYGQHKDHRFSNEPDYDPHRNSTLTDQYGWNVLCNDRAILFSDQSLKTGWETKLHTEHYGFVGFVSFVGPPEKLPWNTTKTDVDLNNEAYALALKDMRLFALKWRATADKRKKTKAAPRRLPPKKSKKAAKKPSTSKPSPSKPTAKVDHNEFRTVLPDDINERFCNDKHLALVHEAKLLDLDELTYSGLALIRMLFESSAITYLDRHGRYSDLVNFAIEKYEKKLEKLQKDIPEEKKKTTLSDEERKKFVPKVDDMIPFFHNHPELWGAAKASHLKHSLSNMAKYQPRLNSVLHNPFQAINRTEAFQIRDEVLPLLRHMIET
jgi:hypothetical protein